MRIMTKSPSRSLFVLALAVILTGLVAGISGMLLAMLLHAIQHLFFGYSLPHIISQESFLQGVIAASPLRRAGVLMFCGLVAGGGWWLLYRHARPLVSIARALASAKPAMPVAATLIHALLQITTVALGSPLGREVAPREVGAMSAGRLARILGLGDADTRILMACGAGAGLAAVYNVPLGGALFVLEVLMGTFSFTVMIPALACCAIAAMVAWAGLGNETQYHLPALAVTPALLVWSLLAGPLFGLAAYGFSRLTRSARDRAPRNALLPVLCLLNFTVIGLLAATFPALLGNGKGPAQLSFGNHLLMATAATLLVLKIAAIWGSLRAGAQGGLLTPGLTCGALLACLLGGAWNHLWPGTAPGAFAVIGGGAFLAASMTMPLTAIVLIFEFTDLTLNFLPPMIVAVTGAMCLFKFCQSRAAPK